MAETRAVNCMLRALAAGLAIAVIVIEALLAGLQLYTGSHAHIELAAGQVLPTTILLVTGTFWLLGGVLAGAMATGVSGWRITGWMAGALLTLPLLVMLLLAGFPWAVTLFAGAPLAGSIAGAAAASRALAGG
jgi:hypothetical protein